MILIVDNYDSFAYNLVQYVGDVVTSPGPATQSQDLGEVSTSSAPATRPQDGGESEAVVVRRNDAIDVAGIRDLDPDGIIVSPGPGTPESAGVSIDVFAETTYPALGVCLGHQALCAANGATVGHAPEVVHGKPSSVRHDGAGLYEGIDDPFEVGRYHSLAVERTDLPAELIETAHTDDERDVVMGVRHVERPHIGVQFHPESILTDAGKGMIRNFCQTVAGV